MEDRYFGLVDQMHSKFGFYEAAEKMDHETFLKFLEFRVGTQIQEEVTEFLDALTAYREAKNEDARIKACEEMNDALIDILVFTFGTATFTMAHGELTDSYDTVMEANLKKEAGVKPGRPNPLGLPDLLKPEGWTPPDIRPFSKCLINFLKASKRRKKQPTPEPTDEEIAAAA